MQRFKKILVFVGGEADPVPALDAAAERALHNSAQLTLIDVLPESTEGPWLTVAGKPELEKLVVSSRSQELDEMAASLRDRGLEVETEVTMGSPFVEMIRRVVVEDHDLVVKTAQNADSPLRGLMGTTALHLTRKCPAPVWVVKPPTAERFDRILAAVDPRAGTDDDNQLSLKVLQLAASMAEATGSKLDILHAWWLYSEPTLRSRRINMPPTELDGLLREVRETAENALDTLVAEADIRIPFEIHLVKGLPYEVISHYASESDVTVMGTLSRSGVDGLLIGNTAERVLRRVESSVLTVKPDGFRTPLRFDLPRVASSVA